MTCFNFDMISNQEVQHGRTSYAEHATFLRRRSSVYFTLSINGSRMTDSQNKSNAQRKSWLGIFFIFTGVVFLAPLFYRSPDSFNDRNVVGPFFGICLGLTFLIVGILRISKSQKPEEISSDRINEQFSMTHDDNIMPKRNPEEISHDRVNEQFSIKLSSNIEPNKRKTPMFIKWVAWSPAIPLCILLIVQTSCDLFSLGTCKEHYSFMEVMGYFGGLGWIVSLPIAGMLKMIHSAASSD